MTGGLHVNDGENSYYMYSFGRDPLWTIRDFRSDNPDWGCYQADPYVSCSGAAGYWVLTSPPSPIPAPEPDMLAAFGLLTLGLLGARAAERWRRTHHRDGPGRRAIGAGTEDPAGPHPARRRDERPRETRVRPRFHG